MTGKDESWQGSTVGVVTDLGPAGPGAPVSALILAAGFSSRMAPAFKPVLPLNDTPMVCAVIDLFYGAGVRDIVVVAGHNHGQVKSAVKNTPARVVVNSDYALGMFSSIRTGAGEIDPESQGFFLLPVDIPAVRPSTLARIKAAFLKKPDLPVIPCFNGKTGHPPLIPCAAVESIMHAGSDNNLRDILFAKAYTCLAVHDQGILMDADTPEGYEAVKEQFAKRLVPNRTECLSMIGAELSGEQEIKAHLLLVEKTAMALYNALLPVLPGLNPDLVRAAALLHDIKRNVSHHDRAAEKFLLDMGFAELAAVVGAHMTLENPGEEPGEKEIVYFADKVCPGACLDLDYESRFRRKARDYPEARERIKQRLEIARYIHARISAITGRSVKQILG